MIRREQKRHFCGRCPRGGTSGRCSKGEPGRIEFQAVVAASLPSTWPLARRLWFSSRLSLLPRVWAHLQAGAFPSVRSKSTRRRAHCSSSASVPGSGWRAGCRSLSSLSSTPASEHRTPSPVSLVLLGLLVVLNQNLSILVKSVLTFPRLPPKKAQVSLVLSRT